NKAPAEVSNLPKALKAELAATIEPALTLAATQTSSDDQTIKWLWNLPDGEQIETVLMHYRDRSTVCVSSQAGCAMGCGFCATGQAGYDRNLSVGEILEQIVAARRAAAPRRLSNIVFMGMGEPFANYDRLIESLHRIIADFGIGARNITVSTVGLVPQMLRFAEERLQVGLALSLHAANNDLRTELVPINSRHPIEDLVAACQLYRERTGRRVSLEWAMIDGVNDRPSDSAELAAVAKDARAHVNLIPLNPTPGWPTVGSPRDRIDEFVADLRNRGVNATVRANRGTEIDAACGQLAAGDKPAKTPTPVIISNPSEPG
ncbi:MAG: 23S rRNA (adenine(2503)-C(2))-methyltransferase RlmN, partial [Acidimicrobiales bacterium]